MVRRSPEFRFLDVLLTAYTYATSAQGYMTAGVFETKEDLVRARTDMSLARQWLATAMEEAPSDQIREEVDLILTEAERVQDEIERAYPGATIPKGRRPKHITILITKYLATKFNPRKNVTPAGVRWENITQFK